MACKINIKAANGQNSKLFIDIVNSGLDMKEAVNTYYYTRTDEFLNRFDGKKDENDEPLYSEIAKESLDDMDYAKVELDGRADVYKELLNAIPKAVETIDERLDFLGSSLKTSKEGKEVIEDLKRLKEMLETGNIESSVPKFLKMAERQTYSLFKNAEKFSKGSNKDFKKLSNIYRVSQTYNSAVAIQQSLDLDPKAYSVFKEIANVGYITENMRRIEAIYINQAIEVLAEEFHKRDQTWSKNEIKQYLRNAPRDTPWLDSMMQFIGDSHDRTISMVARIMNEAELTKRKESVEFAEELKTELELLESASNKKGEKIFENLLVKNAKGEWHVIDDKAQNTSGVDLLADKMYEKYQTLTAAEKRFLAFYNDKMQNLQAGLPSNSTIGSRVPTVLRSQWELMEGKTIKEKQALISDYVQNKFLRSNLDMERGQITDAFGKPLRRIPTFYTQPYNSLDYNEMYKVSLEKNLKEGMDQKDAEDNAAKVAEAFAIQEMSKKVSLDLASSLQAFHAMATNYTTKNELLHVFDAAENVIAGDYRSYARTDGNGRVLSDLTPIKGSESQAGKSLKKYFDMQLYGQKEKDLGFVEISGVQIDWNSTLRALGNYTSLVNQAFHVIGGLGNIATGEYGTVMESIAGEFFKPKDLVKATGTYKKHLGSVIKDIGARTPTSLLNLLDAHYDILQAYHPDKMSASERAKWKRLMKTDSVFFIQGVGEHFMQLQGGLAMMNSIEMFNKDGSSAGSLFDNHKVEGSKLIVPSDLYIKEKDGTLVQFDENQQNRVSLKIGAVLRKIHGNYSTKTANELQNDARTALLMKFRGWMYEGFKKRFTNKRDFHLLESEVEGFYQTGGKVFLQLAKDLSKLNLQMAKENWSALTPHEKANMRRFITETASIVLLGISGAMLGKAGKMLDDDLDRNKLTDRAILGSFSLLNYEVNRLYTEVFAFANPAEFVKLLRTPAASISVVENMINLLTRVGTMSLGEQYETGWRAGDYKITWDISKLIPIYKQLITLNIDGVNDKTAFYN